MKRPRFAAHVSHERWLVSYADFVTLLFAFFVVLYASAQMDQRKAGRLSQAIESAFQQLGIFQTEGHTPGNLPHSLPLGGHRTPQGDPPVSLARIASQTQGPQEVNHQKEDLAALRAELEKALASEIARNEAALRLEPDGLVVSLREMGFFDSGSATIKPEAEAALHRVALILHEHSCAVRIEGHTDPVPIHTLQFASNWELSTARATELVKLLIERHGISPDRLSAAGFAEFHPVASNATAQGRQLNRRVDVVILQASLRPPLLPDIASSAPKAAHPTASIKHPTPPPNSDGKTG